MARTKGVVSFADQVKTLDVGQTCTKTKRIGLNTNATRSINDNLAAMRATVNQTVSLIRKMTGSNFRVESASPMTDDKTAILLTVAVTRLPGEIDDI